MQKWKELDFFDDKLIAFSRFHLKRGETLELEADFEAPTWNQIYAMLLRQAQKIRQSNFKPNIIVGVKRGGWIPARVLSDLLEISDLATLGVEFYLGVTKTRKEPVLTKSVSGVVAGNNALVVDDVADSGKSRQLVKEHILQQGAREVRIATLYCKPFSVTKPEYYESETRGWVVFPWDTKEIIRKIVEKHKDKRDIAVETGKLVKAGLPKKRIDKFLKEMLEDRNC